MTKHPGRKRKSGPRHPSGRLKVERVGPTPEQAARRQFLAGVDENGKPRDPNLTGYPLGVLLVNDSITENQHSAGCRYGRLYEIVFGKVTIPTANYDGVARGSGRDMPDKEFAKYSRELTRAMSALDKQKLRPVIDPVCVFGKIPNWARPIPPTLGDIAHAARLKLGLDVLVANMKDVLGDG